MLVAASVAFALVVAWAAKKAGSAPIVGAFAAGTALARTNRRHDIETALKPVVDIFAPVFFVFVGAQVDVRLLNPIVGRQSAGALARSRPDRRRLRREVSGGLLRVGAGAARLHRRRDGAARRGGADLRLDGPRHEGAARARLRRAARRGLRDDLRDAAACSRPCGREGAGLAAAYSRRRVRQRRVQQRPALRVDPVEQRLEDERDAVLAVRVDVVQVGGERLDDPGDRDLAARRREAESRRGSPSISPARVRSSRIASVSGDGACGFVSSSVSGAGSKLDMRSSIRIAFSARPSRVAGRAGAGDLASGARASARRRAGSAPRRSRARGSRRA